MHHRINLKVTCAAFGLARLLVIVAKTMKKRFVFIYLKKLTKIKILLTTS